MYRRYRKGIFVVAYSTKPLRYLLLHRKWHWKGWEFPKGGLLANEKYEHAVAREVKEETGLKVLKMKRFNIKGKFIYDKKAQQHWKAKGFSYVLFAAEVKKAKAKITKEHDDFKWLPYTKALKLLTWPNQKKCLKLVNKFITS